MGRGVGDQLSMASTSQSRKATASRRVRVHPVPPMWIPIESSASPQYDPVVNSHVRNSPSGLSLMGSTDFRFFIGFLSFPPFGVFLFGFRCMTVFVDGLEAVLFDVETFNEGVPVFEAFRTDNGYNVVCPHGGLGKEPITDAAAM
jgi:hypothetical protein